MNKKTLTLVAAPSILLIVVIIFIYSLFERNTHGLDLASFKVTETKPTLTSPQKNNAKTNFIIILADDLGYGDIGVNGTKAIKTPEIDKLAAQGVNFTQGYASAPICSPSRAGLLTGRYPVRTGIIQPMGAANDTLLRKISREVTTFASNLGAIDNIGGANLTKFLPLDEYTIAEMLHDSGYKTAAFGKWHLGDFSVAPEYHPKHYGFDKFVGFNMSNDDWPVAFFRDENKEITDIGLEQAHYTKLFTDEAVDFIDNANDQPFFIYLSQKDPHQPFFPSEDFKGKSDAGPYGDAVSEFDWSVGEIIRALKENKLDENTLVIVTSDNGPWFQGSAAGLRGRKGQSFEGGFRVPTILWGTEHVKANSTITTPIMHIDFMSTIAEIAGIALIQDRIIDGKSLLPLLTDKLNGKLAGNSDTLENRALYFFHDFDLEAIRKGKWKYINRNSHYVWPAPLDKPDTAVGSALAMMNYTPPGQTESIPTLGEWPALYQLDIDSNESYNVAKKHVEKTQSLAAELNRFQQSYINNPRGWLAK